MTASRSYFWQDRCLTYGDREKKYWERQPGTLSSTWAGRKLFINDRNEASVGKEESGLGKYKRSRGKYLALIPSRFMLSLNLNKSQNWLMKSVGKVGSLASVQRPAPSLVALIRIHWVEIAELISAPNYNSCKRLGLSEQNTHFKEKSYTFMICSSRT